MLECCLPCTLDCRQACRGPRGVGDSPPYIVHLITPSIAWIFQRLDKLLKLAAGKRGGGGGGRIWTPVWSVNPVVQAARILPHSQDGFLILTPKEGAMVFVGAPLLCFPCGSARWAGYTGA